MAMVKTTDNLSKVAVEILAGAMRRNQLYASPEETDRWLETETGARIQHLINIRRNQNGNL